MPCSRVSAVRKLNVLGFDAFSFELFEYSTDEDGCVAVFSWASVKSYHFHSSHGIVEMAFGIKG